MPNDYQPEKPIYMATHVDDITAAAVIFSIITDKLWDRSLAWDEAGEPWSILEWAGAMCGEAGEAANIAKKLRRFDQGKVGQSTDPATRERLRDELGKELADTFVYLMIMAAKERLDMWAYVREVFNAKSEEYNFPHRL